MFKQQQNESLHDTASCPECAYHFGGTCRRHAPQPYLFGPFSVLTENRPFPKTLADEAAIWPEVRKTDWCGEFRRNWSEPKANSRG